MLDKLFSDILVPVITTVVGALIGWLSGRSKEKSLIRAGEIENAAKVLEMSERIANRLEAQLARQMDTINELNTTINNLQRTANESQEQLEVVQYEYKKLKGMYNDQVVELDALRSECAELKAFVNQSKIQN